MKIPVNKNLKSIEIRNLLFDPLNPRLPEDIDGDIDTDVLDFLLGDANLDDLMKSIGSQGYFEGEPLLVVEDSTDSNKYIVVEGNRRLGALKLLSGTEAPRKVNLVQRILEETDKKFDSASLIPCIVFSKRDDILGYLGYRHITGIKEWDHLAKARYLQQLYESMKKQHRYLHVDEIEIYRELAKNIGSRSDYVSTLLQALSILEFADERDILRSLGKRPNDLHFSLLTTAIGYSSIKNYLYRIDGDERESTETYVKSNLTSERVENVFLWLYGSSTRPSIIGESRNIVKLSKVLSDSDASTYFMRNIEATDILATSFNLAGGLLEGFERIIVELKSKLENLENIYPDIQQDIREDHVVSLKEYLTKVRHFARNVEDDFNGDDE